MTGVGIQIPIEITVRSQQAEQALRTGVNKALDETTRKLKEQGLTATEVQQSLTKMGVSLRDSADSLRRVAAASPSAKLRELQEDLKRLKADLDAGVISSDRFALEQRTIEAELRKVSQASQLTGKDLRTYNGLLKEVQTETGRGSRGLGTLTSAALSMSSQFAGTNSTATRFLGTMASFAIGGPIGAGVIAFFTLLVGLVEKVGQKAREARKEAQDLIGSLVKGAQSEQDRLNPEAVAKRELDTIQARSNKLAADLAAARAGRTVTSRGGAPIHIRDEGLIAQLEQEARDIPTAVAEVIRVRNEARRQLDADNARGTSGGGAGAGGAGAGGGRADRADTSDWRAAQRYAAQAERDARQAMLAAVREAQREVQANAHALTAAAAEAKRAFDKNLNDTASALGTGRPTGADGKPLTYFFEDDAKRTRELQEQGRAIERSARAAVDLARGFGLVSEKTARSLENVASLAANIPNLVGQIDLLSKPGGFSAKNALGAASVGLQVAGAAGSLLQSVFGESPETRAMKDAIERNVLALQRNTSALESRLTGTQITSTQATIKGALNVGFDLSKQPYARQEEILRARTRGHEAALADAAKAAGVELVYTVQGFQQLAEQLKKGEFLKYADSFDGRMQKLADTFNILNVSDPTEQLKTFATTVASISPIIAQTLAKFDLDTAQGRADAAAALQEVYKHEGKLKPAQRGDVTGAQFNQLLGDAIAYVTNAGAPKSEGGLAPNRSLASVSQITAGGADMITSQLSSSNAFLSQIAASTAAIATASAATQGPSAFAFTFMPGSVTVDADGSVTVTPSLVDAVNVSLGASLNRQAGNYGNVVMT